MLRASSRRPKPSPGKPSSCSVFPATASGRFPTACSPLPDGALAELGTVRLKSGKQITAWAVEGDLDADTAESNTFEVEWPPRSGRIQTYPEVDRAGWFGIEAARRKLNPAQAAFLDRLPPL